MCFLAYQVAKIKSDSGNGEKPENGQDGLAIIPREIHTEGHSFILCEMNDEPVPDNMDFLADSHVCLDQYFYELIK